MFELKNGRLHGNGFLQFDMAPGLRLHIWPESDSKLIKAQKTRTPIHDHAFDFTSTILVGNLLHKVYSCDEIIPYFTDSNVAKTYHVYKAQKTSTENTVLVKDDDKEYALVRCQESKYIQKGHSYDFEGGRFHESVNTGPGITASIMFKTKIYSGYKPRVLCLSTETPDNDFSRYSVDQSVLNHYVNLLENELKNNHPCCDYFRV